MMWLLVAAKAFLKFQGEINAWYGVLRDAINKLAMAGKMVASAPIKLLIYHS
jgi:hypothetical protein